MVHHVCTYTEGRDNGPVAAGAGALAAISRMNTSVCTAILGGPPVRLDVSVTLFFLSWVYTAVARDT